MNTNKATGKQDELAEEAKPVRIGKARTNNISKPRGRTIVDVRCQDYNAHVREALNLSEATLHGSHQCREQPTTQLHAQEATVQMVGKTCSQLGLTCDVRGATYLLVRSIVCVDATGVVRATAVFQEPDNPTARGFVSRNTSL
jgi:hypothetical protein